MRLNTVAKGLKFSKCDKPAASATGAGNIKILNIRIDRVFFVLAESTLFDPIGKTIPSTGIFVIGIAIGIYPLKSNL